MNNTTEKNESKFLRKNPLKSDYFIRVDSDEQKRFSNFEKIMIAVTITVILIAIIQAIYFHLQFNPV